MKADRRLSLPSVTLCAATSVNVAATIRALDHCRDLAEFAECILFTDDRSAADVPGRRTVGIETLKSSSDYSRFMLRDLVKHVSTDHVLVAQWDGFILDASAWDENFLSFDYIGASWPQFTDGHDVGNGGFSLRSRRLLEACCDPVFVHGGAEDVAICRVNRALLEDGHGICFAPRAVADRFAFERTRAPGPVFGFHGIFNMVEALGIEEFWKVYLGLDERGTTRQDLRTLLSQLGGAGSFRRYARLLLDQLSRSH